MPDETRELSRTETIAEWLAGQPLVPPAIGLAGGIALDAAWPVSWPVSAVLFVLSGVGLYFARGHCNRRHLLIATAAMCVGAVLHDASFRHIPGHHVVRYCSDQPTPIRLKGMVLTAPMIRSVRTGRIEWYKQLPQTRFVVEAEAIEGRNGDIPVTGTVAVSVHEPALHLSAGDRVELHGWLYEPGPPRNPGEKNWRLFHRRKGILAGISCNLAANVKNIESTESATRLIAAVRRRVRAAMLEDVYDRDMPGAGLLSAMVLGQRSAVDPAVNEAFIRTGAVHYLSVSGAHVGMLISAIWLAGWLIGSPRRYNAIAALVVATCYALLAEPRPAIIRAALMADFMCIAVLLRRPVRSLNWLALAAMCLLIFRPTDLFSAGFQLSFVTVAALIFLEPRVHDAGRSLFYRLLRWDDPLLTPAIQRRINPPSSFRRTLDTTLNVLGRCFSYSISAWLVAMLLTAFHFHRIAPWGWLNTVLLMPLIWIIQLLAVTKTVVSVLLPPVAPWLAAPLALLTDWLIMLVQIMGQYPGANLPTASISSMIVCLGLLLVLLASSARRLQISRRWIVSAIGVFFLLTAWHVRPVRSSDTLRLDVLAVGQGTACVIQLPDGDTLVYDLGCTPPRDIERWTLSPFLADQRIYAIDTLILTHPNLDHFSGVPDLIHQRYVGEIISPPHFEHLSQTSVSAKRLITQTERCNVPWRSVVGGDCLASAGDLQIEVLWPPPVDTLAIENVNDSSMVLRISYAGKRILLTGDIEEQAQEHLIETADLAADVLLLPHHGGVTRRTAAFMEAADPDYCIRSSHKRDAQTTNGLLDLMQNRTYFNTAEVGAVTVEITPSELTVRPFITDEGT